MRTELPLIISAAPAKPRRASAFDGQALTSAIDSLIAEIQVWRAATRVHPADIRPTGPAAVDSTSGAWQEHLDHSLAAGTTDDRWSLLRLITELAPGTTADSYTPVLAARLARLSAAGVDLRPLLQSAAADGPLPDDQPAAALWWRIVDHLPRPREDVAQGATAGDIRDAQRARRAAQQARHRRQPRTANTERPGR